VLACGGNTGSQSATLIIRTLALGEASRSGAARIAFRELLIGGMLGSSLGSIAFAIGCSLVAAPHAAVVGITVTLVVTVGTVIGAMLPIWFKWMGVDPALMSNPLIASLSDIMGVVIFYNVARLLVGT
jgi:magnesium transporter